MKIISCIFLASFLSCSTILHSVTKAEENSTPVSTSGTSTTSIKSSSVTSVETSKTEGSTSASKAEENSTPVITSETATTSIKSSSVTSVETSKTEGSTSPSTADLSTTKLKTTTVSSAVKSVLMVCSTNQCRSPIVEAVFEEVARKNGVIDEWHCESAGIYVYSPEARWNMDKRSRATLRNHGIRDRKHVAREVNEKDFNIFDHILGMDEANVEDLRKKAPAGSKAKIELFSVYDPKKSQSIRYPYYDNSTSGFEECYKIAYRTCEAFLKKHAD